MTSRTCVIHFAATDYDEKVNSFSEITFQRVLDFKNKWSTYVCQQGEIARALERTYTLNDISQANHDRLGTHKKCYNRFVRI